MSGTAPAAARRPGGGAWLWRWGPAVALMVVQFVLSSFPKLPKPPGDLTDKDAHGIYYALLAAMLLRGLSGVTWTGVTWGRAAAAVALATLYGVTDELHQTFVPGREASVGDLVADAIGATVAALALRAWAIIRPRR